MTSDIREALSLSCAQELMREGRSHDLSGRPAEAMDCYAAVIELSGNGGDPRVRAEALRRLGVLHHLRAETDVARDYCQQSWQLASESGADELAADACSALAGIALERGDLAEAEQKYSAALQLAPGNTALLAKIEQNLGIIANIRGKWSEALEHYHHSLAAYQAEADQRGCALAHHNLGLIHADQKHWMEADRHYRTAQALADAAGDRHLKGLVALNRAEVRLAIDDLAGARDEASRAMRIFQEIDARRDRAGAHRLLGMIFRQLGRPALAESHLRSAVELAVGASCPLSEADAAKELGRLYHAQGRHDDALAALNRARALYQKLQAEPDLAEVDQQIAEALLLRGTHA